MQQIADRRQVSFAQARIALAQRLASIELFPYHSAGFHVSAACVRELHSVRIAREFVQDWVLGRVRNGNAIVVAMRRAKEWDLPQHSRIICYDRGQARGAHLTPTTPGGRAILEQFSAD